MTSTLKKHSPRPPGGSDCHDSGYCNGTLPNSSAASIDMDDTGSSHCDSVPEFLDLTIVLPDGREQTINVASSKQMMDLLVQVTASNKLSPADHSLKVMSQRHEWMSTFKASQTIGSLQTDVIHLVSKKAEKEKKRRKPQQQQPFEITQRLTVNLPHSQKMMMRISPQTTLAAIFHTICTEKNLDPYKYELRHPTNPNEALNMAGPLSNYHLNTINIVNITGDTSYPSSETALDLASSEDCDTMFTRRKGSKEPPSDPEPFMPGMAAEKKKKGFFSFFRKKGSAKFKPGKMSYPESQPSLSVSENNKTRPKSMFATMPLTRSSSSSCNNVASSQPSAATVQKSQSVRSGPPAKPPRKKRPAPPPPVAASNRKNSVNESLPNIEETTAKTTAISVDVSTAVAHSRHSSHSSGFNETTSSPLESPGNSSHESTAHVTDAPEIDTQTKPDLNSGEISEIKDNLAQEASHPPSVTSVEHTEHESSLSQPTDDEVESSTLHRKRKAPAPPPVGPADEQEVAPPETPEMPLGATEGEEEVNETTTTLVEALQMETISIDATDSTPDSPIKEKPSSPLGGSFVVEDEDLKGALVEELRNDSESAPEGSTSTGEQHQLRLAEFHAPPPPDTPPPPETPSDCPSHVYPQSDDDRGREGERGVVDEAIQVQRSPLSSPREGEDEDDSITDDTSSKSDMTAAEDETPVTSKASGTDFKNTSDVANLIGQILQQADNGTPPPSSDNAAIEPKNVKSVDESLQKDENVTLPLVSASGSETFSCVVTSPAPVIHEECSAIAEVSMPTEILHQSDDSFEDSTVRERVNHASENNYEKASSVQMEDIHQSNTQAESMLEDLSSKNNSSEVSSALEDLGLPAVVYRVPINNKNGQSPAVAKEPVTQQHTSVPSEGVMSVQTTKPEKSEQPGELYTFSVTTEYVIKDDATPVKEPPAPEPSTPEAPIKDDATLFKVPSVPRMKQTPRVNSLREVYRKPIPSNSYLGGSNGHLVSPTRELIPPPLSAASREAAVNSTRQVSRKCSYDSIARVTAPQPWGTRYTSEPSVKDIRKALLISRDSSLTRDASSPLDRSQMHESSSRNSSFSSSSEINFQPSTADESQNVLEEKSISMIALPSERKTTPRKRTTWSDRRHYSSMVSLVTQNESALSLPPSVALQNSSSMEQLATTPNSKDKARRTLQSQYSDIEMQFSKWQQQLMKNQALLMQKNLLSRSERPRDASCERDGYRRSTSRAASEKRRSFIDDRPPFTDREVQRLSSGLASEKQRSLIDDPLVVQDTAQEVREGTVEDLTTVGVQSPREGTVALCSERVGRQPRSAGQRNTGLGGKFTPDELTSAKRILRQNSNEQPATTTIFKAVQNSTTLPRQSASTAMRTASPIRRVESPVRRVGSPVRRVGSPVRRVGSPVRRVGSPVCLSGSPMRQSRPQGRWPGSPAQGKGSQGQRSGSPPPVVLLTRDTPQKVTKAASSRSREVNQKRFERKLDPREELMIAIRNAGAKNILKKSSSTDTK